MGRRWFGREHRKIQCQRQWQLDVKWSMHITKCCSRWSDLSKQWQSIRYEWRFVRSFSWSSSRHMHVLQRGSKTWIRETLSGRRHCGTMSFMAICRYWNTRCFRQWASFVRGQISRRLPRPFNAVGRRRMCRVPRKKIPWYWVWFTYGPSSRSFDGECWSFVNAIWYQRLVGQDMLWQLPSQ